MRNSVPLDWLVAEWEKQLLDKAKRYIVPVTEIRFQLQLRLKNSFQRENWKKK